MKTKSYKVTENGIVSIVEATSKDAAAAKHFGVERAVHCMVPRGAFGSHRNSKNNPGARHAFVEVVAKAEGRS